uniref:Uncharacterized protein n=1 Tax=Rhabditophanes sp. KR3021 TaxID=114890 RepID=A0AC35TYP5_9BILA
MVRGTQINDDIDYTTKWWSSYGTKNYTDMAKAQTTFDSYIGDVYSKPKRYARSASMTNLTYIKEAVHELPIKRSPSVSSLAPSLALAQDMRQAKRYVNSTYVYKPVIHTWYNNSYSPAKWRDTQVAMSKPIHNRDTGVSVRSSHVPYYTFQTKRIFDHEREKSKKSYLTGSYEYMNRYVSARLKADDFAGRFVHTAYDARKSGQHAVDRHYTFDNSVFIPHAYGNPHSYNNAKFSRSMYKTIGRYNF